MDEYRLAVSGGARHAPEGAPVPTLTSVGSVSAATHDEPYGAAAMLRAVLRHRWTFLLTTVLFSALGLAAVVLTAKPKYIATSRVEVLPSKSRVLYRDAGEMYGGDQFFQQYLNTQVELIRGPVVLGRVLEDSEVQQTTWYREPDRPLLGELPSDLERLTGAVQVAVRPGTFVVEISATGPEADDAVLLANKIRDHFLLVVKESLASSSSTVGDRLDTERREVEARISVHRQRTEAALKRLQVTSASQLVALRGEELRALDLDIRARRMEIRQINAELRNLDQVIEDVGSENPDRDLLKYPGDQRWLKLKATVEDVESRIRLASESFGPRHPTMLQLQADLEAAKRDLRDWEIALDAGASSAPVDSAQRPRDRKSLESRRQNIEEEIALLREEFDRETDRFNSDLEQVLDYELDAKDFEYAVAKHDMIRARLDELQMEKQLGSVRRAGDAIRPTRPSNWKQPYMFAAAVLVMSVAAGFVTANWRAAQNVDVQRPGALGDAPLLGSLPPPRGSTIDLTVLDAAQSESIRIVRTSVLHRLSIDNGRTVMITSAGPGAGKSTVSIMLARSMADSGKRVLLVDADLRRPALARYLKIPSDRGLADVLRGDCSDKDVIQHIQPQGISVIPAGRLEGKHEVDILTPEKLSSLLEQWRRDYDHVLIDCCPILPVADARMLLSKASGVIVVAREGRCRTRDLSETLRIVRNVGGKLLGTVFTGARGGSGSYSGYGYDVYGDESLRA